MVHTDVRLRSQSLASLHAVSISLMHSPHVRRIVSCRHYLPSYLAHGRRHPLLCSGCVYPVSYPSRTLVCRVSSLLLSEHSTTCIVRTPLVYLRIALSILSRFSIHLLDSPHVLLPDLCTGYAFLCESSWISQQICDVGPKHTSVCI